MPISPDMYKDKSTGLSWKDMERAGMRNGVSTTDWQSRIGRVDMMVIADLHGEGPEAFGEPPNENYPHEYQVGRGPKGFGVEWTGIDDSVGIIRRGTVTPVSVLPIMRASNNGELAEGVRLVKKSIETVVFFPPRFINLARWTAQTSRSGR